MNLPLIPSFHRFAKEDFISFSNELFRYQSVNNLIYQTFIKGSHHVVAENFQPVQFPFLPISFFKTHEVFCGDELPALFFESSGTGGQTVSKHYIRNVNIYTASFSEAFRLNYGDPSEWCILALLPSYLERSHSSLVYMVQSLMQQSGHRSNGFFLHNHDELYECLSKLVSEGQKMLLFGTTFALLDFAEKFQRSLPDTIIVETGGMKGRREELLREQVHEMLRSSFPKASIQSEYGMTELCSQAYAKENGVFVCPPWMKVLVRDEDDPFLVKYFGKGALNIIDLANQHSCAFIATEDVGEVYEDGSFRVLGRLDNSDIRGCSLLTV